MPLAPQQYQPQVGYQPNPQLQALQSVIQAIRGQAGSGSQQPWGFHEPTLNAGAGFEQGLSATGQAMADPRNAWMGLGPLSILGRASRFRRIPDMGTDTGGFSASTRDIRRELGVPRPNMRRGEIPGGEEVGLRKDYLDNITGLNALHDLTKGGPQGDNAQNYESAQRLYSYLTPQGTKAADAVQLGHQALEQELLRQSLTTGGGGGIPSEAMLRRFGFGGNVGEYPGIPRWQHYNKPQ